MSAPTDEGRLIDGFLSGDPEALRVVDGWAEVVLWECARSMQEDWSDLKQEIRTRAFRNLSRGTFEGHSSLRTYVHRIAKNVCIDAVRAERRHRQRDVRLAPESAEIASSARADSAWIARDLLAKILAGFSPDDRALLDLVFVEHLSYIEIARRLSIPEGTVKSRMFRCKNRIVERRKALAGPEGRES